MTTHADHRLEELRSIDLFDELSDEQLAEWVAAAVL